MEIKQIKFEEVFSINNLYNSSKKCFKGVMWKGTVQRYKHHAFTKIVRTHNEVLKGTFKTGDFFKFPQLERGKLRKIQSVIIDERVVQRCLCDEYLMPVTEKKFIYDNAACQKGKGIQFALKRMQKALLDYYKKYKTNKGYILQYDFHHYFETIPHDILINKLDKVVEDKQTMKIITKLINDFEGEVGIGLGSQISQICALFYPNSIDQYYCRSKNIFAYGRYMDDGYIISEDKEILLKYKETLKAFCEELQIVINEKKTVINSLSQGFTFLKAHFKLKDSGAVIIKPNRNNLNKNKLKLRKYREKLDNKQMTWLEIKNIYKGTLKGMQFYDSFNARQSYKRLFFKLFHKELETDSEKMYLLKSHYYN